MAEPLWNRLHRPILAKAVADFDHARVIDVAAYAEELGLACEQIDSALAFAVPGAVLRR